MWTIITVIIVFFAMAGYAGMSYYYSDRFFRGTTINGINCSGKTSEEAEQAVAKKAEDYLLEVKARKLKSQSINGKLIGYRYVSDGSISQYLDEQKPYKWVRGFWKKQNYTAKENMTYDKVKLKEQLEKLECVKKENQTAPEDAYVAYKDSKFEIVPETEGNTLDFNGAYQALSEAVAGKKRTIDLNSCPAVYVKAAVMKDDSDLKNSWEELVYEVEKIDIVTPNDVDAVKIRPGKDMVTLLTCHPYGSNGKYRYLVYCSRVKDAGKDDRKKEVSYAYKDHIVASDGQIYSLSSKDIQKEKYFRWLCAIILFLIMAAMKIKDMWRKRRQT